MLVSIFGLGYVGATAACCIAKQGHRVIGADVSITKVKEINEGQSPITEPGLQELLSKALANGKLHAVTEIGDWISGCDVAVVCVGTPSSPDGSHDMSYVAKVSTQIAQALKDGIQENGITIAFRSTFRPGTMEQLVAPIFRSTLGDELFERVELVYNPEFLREGTAIQDYFNPPKIVVGTHDGRPSERMEKLHKGIDAPVFHVKYRESEITKFVDNTWHAVKVAFANEIGRICHQMDISAKQVHEIFKSDTKLNLSAYYTRPGGAFGGSCLPKDVRALQHISTDVGANTHLIDTLIRTNEAHKLYQFQEATKALAPGSHILLAGVAFKADTDDLRESPNLDLARRILEAGYKLDIFDPGLIAERLVGQNLGYAYSNLPTLNKLLISKEDAESRSYDLVIAANASAAQLTLNGANIISVGAMA